VTPENVQLITQLDSDDAELDLLDDPTIAASLGKMFGNAPTAAAPVAQAPLQAAPQFVPQAKKPQVNTGASFDTLLKSSNGAGAIVARNAYAEQAGTTAARGLTQEVPAIQAQKALIQNGVRDQIRKRLEGMKNA
jgi:hypothetical protein